jgi:hypothetical protein
MTGPFLTYSEKLCNLAREERLRRAFAAHCHDGTEIHHVVDHELVGLEHGVTAMTIKRAIEAKYKNSVPLDAVIEIICELVELTWA